jgi:ATP-dependent phosphoenolpyruvate carboxykinase
MESVTELELAQIVKREVDKYAGLSPHAKVYAVLDDQNKAYTVVGIENKPADERSWVMMLARVVGNLVIIDEDAVWDKKLVYALLQAGVPREQIVLAYEGEPLPTHMQG